MDIDKLYRDEIAELRSQLLSADDKNESLILKVRELENIIELARVANQDLNAAFEHPKSDVQGENEVQRDTSKVGSKLSLLRSCIELLDRLESTSYSHFSGKIMIFLAKVIPFYDQSGLNLRSESSVRDLPKSVTQNLEIINAKRVEKEKQLSQIIERDMEEGETLSDDSNEATSPSFDYKDKLFEKFWKTQQIMSHPNSLYDKSTWAVFRGNVEMLVARFDGKKTYMKVWDLKDSYMTNSKTFDLQANDINMIRCFLVQILIVFQYLDMPVDIRPESFVLDKTQASWLTHTTKKIYAILESLPNHEDGSKFINFIYRIQRNEQMWSQWKNEKCKEPKRPVEDEEGEEEMPNMRGTYHKRRKISDECSNAKAYKMHVIGSMDMSRLWNTKQLPKKYDPPELAKYLSSPNDKQTDNFKDPNHSFKVLRLLRKSPHFFTPSTAVIQSLDEYLKSAAARCQN